LRVMHQKAMSDRLRSLPFDDEDEIRIFPLRN
jgi:hypothetical protein